MLARLGGRYRALKAVASAGPVTTVTQTRPERATVGPATAPPVSNPSIPAILSNRYELISPIGHGRMAEIHRGRDVRLGRSVAVKVLRADLARIPQFQQRFRREAQNAAVLNHPAIVPVYDTGEARTEYGPLPYIVMEYVDGRTLEEIVKREGPMSSVRSMEITADVCAALDFSHRHGIIHRDVKPANIMITKTGSVKVLDFGIARFLDDDNETPGPHSATMMDAVYLSPEQATGKVADARSDVYAIGCTLFYLLTGAPPFTGHSPITIADHHVHAPPPEPSRFNRQISPRLDAIVVMALAKNPLNRYQSAAAMRMDLVRVLSGMGPSAPSLLKNLDSAEDAWPTDQQPRSTHRRFPPVEKRPRRWWFKRQQDDDDVE